MGPWPWPWQRKQEGIQIIYIILSNTKVPKKAKYNKKNICLKVEGLFSNVVFGCWKVPKKKNVKKDYVFIFDSVIRSLKENQA